ncbi:ATP-binding protein [Cerasicoccus fimbriatus]|uniref:ATP-binding protein n=1 Tax=Cerasicoccus fimbriatus TaxID=3014554 RepID=UPI0022B4A9B5|nr:ATP-binding protein [Cerasicoccus sp. TK19100]
MSLSTESESSAELLQHWETDTNRTILKDQPRNLISSWVLATSFALVVSFEFTWLPVFLWLGLMAITSAIRVLIWRSIRRRLEHGGGNEGSSRLLNINAFVGGIPWGVMGFYFWPLQDAEISAFCIFILGGVTAGAMPGMAASRRMYPIFIITCLAPIVIRFCLAPSFSPKVMALVMVFYSIFMIRQATRQRNMLWERFKLTSEKDSLIEDLGREIDDHQETEDKLRHEKQRAEKASRAKTDFVATMSHEIRTPLNCLVGGVNLIRSKSVSPDMQETIELLDLSSQSLLAIVNDILDFSKIEEGKLELDRAPFSPAKTLQQVRKLYKAEAANRGLKLELTISTKLPAYLMGDANRVRQIVTNLVGNALKFTEEGEVSVAAHYQESAKTWQVICSDTGTGISPEYRHLIFKPFTQADSSMARKYGGSGLGLTICNSLAQAMGGSITVDTEYGKGSRFTLTLPAEIADAPPQPEPESTPADPKPKHYSGRVMLFEDDPVSSRVMNMILKKEGVAILHAKTGPSGLEILQNEKADLVLMDLQMPGMDGFETTRSIRQLPDSSATPANVTVVALTANTTADIRQKCLDAGMNQFLTKPMQIDQLRALLASHFADTTTSAEVG